MNVCMRRLFYFAPALLLALSTPGGAPAQGYPGFPYTILAPTHRALSRHRAGQPMRRVHEHAARTQSPRGERLASRKFSFTRSSPGTVLPTPLPRTPLIPPEGGSVVSARPAPQLKPPTVVPGLANPIPNLPHGPETFQDRASRCAFQQGLYNVPGNMSTQYMGACLQ